MFAHFVCMYRISHFKQCIRTFNDSSSRVSYQANRRLYMLLAGNPLIKIEALQVVFYSHGQLSNGKQNSGLEYFITESLLLFAQISFI